MTRPDVIKNANQALIGLFGQDHAQIFSTCMYLATKHLMLGKDLSFQNANRWIAHRANEIVDTSQPDAEFDLEFHGRCRHGEEFRPDPLSGGNEMPPFLRDLISALTQAQGEGAVTGIEVVTS